MHKLILKLHIMTFNNRQLHYEMTIIFCKSSVILLDKMSEGVQK